MYKRAFASIIVELLKCFHDLKTFFLDGLWTVALFLCFSLLKEVLHQFYGVVPSSPSFQPSILQLDLKFVPSLLQKVMHNYCENYNVHQLFFFLFPKKVGLMVFQVALIQWFCAAYIPCHKLTISQFKGIHVQNWLFKKQHQTGQGLLLVVSLFWGRWVAPNPFTLSSSGNNKDLPVVETHRSARTWTYFCHILINLCLPCMPTLEGK